MEKTARITSKGQVTIPVAIRRALGLDSGDKLVFEVDPRHRLAQVRKAADFLELAGSVLVPEEWAGADRETIREAAWAARAASQKPEG
ncbi:MAG: AbrB/MazE/SpoVT family DNA-binding domain-containing protein [Candidatus Dormibacteria bacterium]